MFNNVISLLFLGVLDLVEIRRVIFLSTLNNFCRSGDILMYFVWLLCDKKFTV